MTTATQNDRAADLYQLLIEGDERASRDYAFNAYKNERATIIEICSALAEAFHRIGDAWECSDVDTYQEHVASQIGHRLLLDLRSNIPAAEIDAPKAIGCTPENDPYALPTLMVELVLREQGWEANSLGTNLPLEMLVPALEELQPDLCWVSVSFVASLSRLREQLRCLGEIGLRRGVKVICGGQAINHEVLAGLENVRYLSKLQALTELTD